MYKVIVQDISNDVTLLEEPAGYVVRQGAEIWNFPKNRLGLDGALSQFIDLVRVALVCSGSFENFI